ncbi:MAG: PHP domain-containing protein, partial [Candidatus Eremiobacteraeota bacterium]|nr:PHP domain-containing protein [Candidatus Eremiobacteraeota bacterium]
MIVDFHSHTLQSDGTLSAQELLDAMLSRGVSVCSITDHDTLAAYRGLDIPPRLRVIPGIEINTTYNGNEVHILGYGLPLGDAELGRVLERNREARRSRMAAMVKQLRSAGYEITMGQVLAESGGGESLGRPHVGKALVRHGHVADIQSAFKELLRRGKPGYVPALHIAPQEAIDVINASGGIAVLAHPGRLYDYDIIDEFARSGLRGLEVFYPTHEPAQVQYFRDKAKRCKLVMSGGSDFHDIRYHRSGVGMEVERHDIDPF